MKIQNEIFVLNQPYKEEIEKIIKYDITVELAQYSKSITGTQSKEAIL